MIKRFVAIMLSGAVVLSVFFSFGPENAFANEEGIRLQKEFADFSTENGHTPQTDKGGPSETNGPGDGSPTGDVVEGGSGGGSDPSDAGEDGLDGADPGESPDPDETGEGGSGEGTDETDEGIPGESPGPGETEEVGPGEDPGEEEMTEDAPAEAPGPGNGDDSGSGENDGSAGPATDAINALAEDGFIEIGDEESLADIGRIEEYPLNGKYILTGNIILSDDWTPAGSAPMPFTGTLDGGGYTIGGLLIDEPDGPAGLFACIGSGAKIKNLTIEVDYIFGGAGAGALAGQSTGGSFTNCFVTGKNADALIESETHAGGLVGSVTGNAVFSGCGSLVDVTSYQGWAGGLAGYISGKGPNSRAVSEKSYAVGAVTQANGPSSAKGAGGLIGFAGNINIRDCYATGDVSSEAWSAGGLVGNAENASIERCLASGNVRTYRAGSGGIVFSAGLASSVRNSVAANKYLAVFDRYSRSCPITTSTPDSSLYGNIHYSSMAFTPDNDYTLRGAPKDITALRAQSTYAGLKWDFETVWEWDPASGSPRLRSEGPQPADTLGLSGNAPLIVSEPPSSPRLYASEKLELAAGVKGAGVSYQWYRDGEPLEDSPAGEDDPDIEIVSGSGAAALSIENIEYRPVSVYVLLATNAYGGTVSSRATVYVSHAASLPSIRLHPASQEKGDGARAVFSIEAENNKGEVLSYLWEKSPGPDGPWEAIPRSGSSTYTTPVLSVEDNGAWYRCVVTNTLGPTSKTVETSSAMLTVYRSIKRVEISEAFISMQPGDKRQLTAICLPEAEGRDDSILWNIDIGSTVVALDIGTGEVEAVRPGTATVLAMANANTNIYEICFIEVTEGSVGGGAPGGSDDGTPRLPVGMATVYSKSSEGAAVKMLPGDSGPYDSINIASVSPSPNAGSFAVDATGAPTCMVSAQGVPKGKYVLWLKAVKGGAETGEAFKLTVTVKSGMPKAKAKLPALNTFYADAAGLIKVSGADLPEISRMELVASAKKADGDITQNFGVYDDGAGFILYAKSSFGSLLKGKPAVKGVLYIWYKGFAEPYKVNIKVPAKAKPPKAKLTKATRLIDPENGLSVDFAFAGPDIFAAAPADEAKFKKMFEDYGYDSETITLDLDYYSIYGTNGKIKKSVIGKTCTAKMDIWLEGARNPLTLKAGVKILKVKTRPNFSLSKKSVTVNKRYEGQRADIEVRCNQENADYYIESIICDNYLDINDFGTHLTVAPGPQAKAGSYPCKAVVSYNGKNTVLPFTVKVINKAKKVRLTGKKGKIDLNDRENTSILYTPKLGNYRGEAIDVWVESGGGPELFSAGLTGSGRIELRANTGLGYDEDFIQGKTYKVKLGLELEAVEADDTGEPYYEEAEATVKVKPVRSKVKHSLPKTVPLYKSRASYKEVVDLSPASPRGARIDASFFDNDTFYLYLDPDQRLHIMIKDSAVTPGRKKLVLPVVYEGQGLDLDKKSGEYFYKEFKITLKVEVFK